MKSESGGNADLPFKLQSGKQSSRQSQKYKQVASRVMNKQSNYSRFKLQEQIKVLVRPKATPIVGQRLRELSNVVLEQHIAKQYLTLGPNHKFPETVSAARNHTCHQYQTFDNSVDTQPSFGITNKGLPARRLNRPQSSHIGQSATNRRRPYGQIQTPLQAYSGVVNAAHGLTNRQKYHPNQVDRARQASLGQYQKGASEMAALLSRAKQQNQVIYSQQCAIIRDQKTSQGVSGSFEIKSKGFGASQNVTGDLSNRQNLNQPQIMPPQENFNRTQPSLNLDCKFSEAENSSQPQKLTLKSIQGPEMFSERIQPIRARLVSAKNSNKGTANNMAQTQRSQFRGSALVCGTERKSGGIGARMDAHLLTQTDLMTVKKPKIFSQAEVLITPQTRISRHIERRRGVQGDRGADKSGAQNERGQNGEDLVEMEGLQIEFGEGATLEEKSYPDKYNNTIMKESISKESNQASGAHVVENHKRAQISKNEGESGQGRVYVSQDLPAGSFAHQKDSVFGNEENQNHLSKRRPSSIHGITDHVAPKMEQKGTLDSSVVLSKLEPESGFNKVKSSNNSKIEQIGTDYQPVIKQGLKSRRLSPSSYLQRSRISSPSKGGRQRLDSQSDAHKGCKSRMCNKFKDRSLIMNQKVIDNLYQNSSKSKIYFRPSVVEVTQEFEQLEKCESKMRSSRGFSPLGTHQDASKDYPKYLLQPQAATQEERMGISEAEESFSKGGMGGQDRQQQLMPIVERTASEISLAALQTITANKKGGGVGADLLQDPLDQATLNAILEMGPIPDTANDEFTNSQTALMAAQELENFADSNPEMQEFIKYLQKVQPNLLQQPQSKTMKVINNRRSERNSRLSKNKKHHLVKQQDTKKELEGSVEGGKSEGGQIEIKAKSPNGNEVIIDSSRQKSSPTNNHTPRNLDNTLKKSKDYGTINNDKEVSTPKQKENKEVEEESENGIEVENTELDKGDHLVLEQEVQILKNQVNLAEQRSEQILIPSQRIQEMNNLNLNRVYQDKEQLRSQILSEERKEPATTQRIDEEKENAGATPETGTVEISAVRTQQNEQKSELQEQAANKIVQHQKLVNEQSESANSLPQLSSKEEEEEEVGLESGAELDEDQSVVEQGKFFKLDTETKEQFEEDAKTHQGQVDKMELLFNQIMQNRESQQFSQVKYQKLIFQPILKQSRLIEMKQREPILHPQTSKRLFASEVPHKRIPNPVYREERQLLREQNEIVRRQSQHNVSNQQSDQNEELKIGQNKILESSQIGRGGAFDVMVQRKKAQKMVSFGDFVQENYLPQYDEQIQHQIRENQEQNQQQYWIQNQEGTQESKSFSGNDTIREETYRGSDLTGTRKSSSQYVRTQRYSTQTGTVEADETAKTVMSDLTKSLAKSSKKSEIEASNQEGVERKTDLEKQEMEKLKKQYELLKEQYLLEYGHELPSDMDEEKTNKSLNQKVNQQQQPDTSHHSGQVSSKNVTQQHGNTTLSNSTEMEGGAKDEDTFEHLFYKKSEMEANKKKEREEEGSRLFDSKANLIDQKKEKARLDAIERRKKIREEREKQKIQHKREHIYDTSNRQLLDNKQIKNLFDPEKLKMSNYLRGVTAPDHVSRQYLRDSKQSDSQSIQQRGPESKASKKSNKKDSVLSNKSAELKQQQGLNQKQSAHFSFENKDRYKTEQLKQQAMVLLVPGYLNYVYNVS